MGLLDLSRRRVTFHQNDVFDLDWDKMKASFSEANSGSIDVKSLADRQHNAAFFLSEIERRFAQQSRAVIVLSSPMVFETGQEILEAPSRPAKGPGLLYPGPEPYRDRSRSQQRNVPAPRPRGFPGRPRTPVGEEFPSVEIDQLEPFLKPLDPRLFDVLSAEQFRKALAAIMSEISAM